MVFNEAMQLIKKKLEEAAAAYPDSLFGEEKPKLHTEAYVLDENGDETENYESSGAEIWGELLFNPECDEMNSMEFALCVSLKNGKADEEELKEALAEFDSEVKDFYDRLSSGATFGDTVAVIRAAQEKEADAAIKEFEKSMFSYKKMALLTCSAAVIIIAILLLLEKILT